nr:BLUF domain-containing protein [uncultured Sphingosinicella sp.]
MITSLLYVSRSTLVLPEQGKELDAIVEVGRSRNESLNVTGALIFTRRHFAQILEGSAAAVDELMTSISADSRHSDVDVIDVREVRGGQFVRWSLAYSGFATYVDEHIVALIDRPSGDAATLKVKDLRRLILDLAIASG